MFNMKLKCINTGTGLVPAIRQKSKGNVYLVGTDRKSYSKPLIQEAFDKYLGLKDKDQSCLTNLVFLFYFQCGMIDKSKDQIMPNVMYHCQNNVERQTIRI
jgi:hypothetical protein